MLYQVFLLGPVPNDGPRHENFNESITDFISINFPPDNSTFLLLNWCIWARVKGRQCFFTGSRRYSSKRMTKVRLSWGK